MSKMTLTACERRAQDDDASDKATFDLCGPVGRFRCKWLDAYMGLFVKADDASKGFFMVRDFDAPEIWVENYDATGA
jgi:hypothetical protein